MERKKAELEKVDRKDDDDDDDDDNTDDKMNGENEKTEASEEDNSDTRSTKRTQDTEDGELQDSFRKNYRPLKGRRPSKTPPGFEDVNPFSALDLDDSDSPLVIDGFFAGGAGDVSSA
jgi:hypothetical protein